jgi:hypothetical protein
MDLPRRLCILLFDIPHRKEPGQAVVFAEPNGRARSSCYSMAFLHYEDLFPLSLFVVTKQSLYSTQGENGMDLNVMCGLF